MSRLSWALARLTVKLLVGGVQRTRALPVASGERPARLPTPGMIALGLGALERAAASGARRLDDPQGRWRELGNKVQAFIQFRRAAEPGEADGVFADLWRREGRGYLLGRQAAAGREEMDPDPARRNLIPHHTGLGLGLASYHFDGLGRRASGAQLRETVERFLADSRRLSLPGYEGLVLEALGLTIQLSHPHLLLRVDRELAPRSERVRALFWHGVGRGLYFDSREMPPAASGTWRAADRALSLPPNDETRHNAVAGLAWATTLVNFCAPEIIAARLREPLLLETGDAAANGVASVTLLWLDAVGDGPLLRGFRDHWTAPEAEAVGPRRRELLAAIELGVDRVYPLLAERAQLDELFRYRPVDGWAESFSEDAGRAAARPREVPAHG